MPKAKWLLTARTTNGERIPKDVDPIASALGKPSVTHAVYDRDELNASLRAAGERTDLTVSVTPVRQSGPRRCH